MRSTRAQSPFSISTQSPFEPFHDRNWQRTATSELPEIQGIQKMRGAPLLPILFLYYDLNKLFILYIMDLNEVCKILLIIPMWPL